MYIDEAMYVSRPHSSYIVRVLYIMALLSILCVLFLTRLGDLGNYHGDESLWLTVSTKLFRLYAFEHQFDDPAWHQEYSTFGSRQPQIGKYLIGLHHHGRFQGRTSTVRLAMGSESDLELGSPCTTS